MPTHQTAEVSYILDAESCNTTTYERHQKLLIGIVPGKLVKLRKLFKDVAWRYLTHVFIKGYYCITLPLQSFCLAPYSPEPVESLTRCTPGMITILITAENKYLIFVKCFYPSHYSTSLNSPSTNIYQVSSLIVSPSTNSVLTHLGIYLFFSSEYVHSASVIQEPFFALTLPPLPAQHITESSPVLSILAP